MKYISYCEIYRKCKNKEYIIDLREDIVKRSYEIGILPTSKEYKTSRNTIKRWRKRYLKFGRQGLSDGDKTPHNIPKMTSSELIDKITSLTKEKKSNKHLVTSTKVYRVLKLENDISYETCNKYVNLALGKKKKRKAVKTNGGDVSWKEKLKPFERIQVDVKYLTDIDSLKPYFKKSKELGVERILSKYEFTFRDIATGFAFVSYASEKSVTNCELFFKNVIYKFLSGIPNLDLKNVIFQTDNGAENTNRKRKGPYVGVNKKSIVTEFIEKYFKEHKTIIPGHSTAQSDVESFHWTIERECLAWEPIKDNETLLYYTNQFLKEYNNQTRWNRDYTPVQKLEDYFKCKIEVPNAIILD